MILSLLCSCFSQIGISHVRASDTYDDMRVKWADTLTGGTGNNTSDPDVAKKLSMIAQTSWSTMNKAANRTYLWSAYNTSDPVNSQNFVTYTKSVQRNAFWA